MGDVAVQRMPWEPVPVAETVALLQADMAYMVTHTAIMVSSNHDGLLMLVNTARGQIVPRGVCKFTDGTTVEFHDIGMPQPGLPQMTVKELISKVLEIAATLGLELET